MSLVPAQAATQEEARSLAVSDVLYPASRNWPLISASPVLPADKRVALNDELERAYRAALKKELEQTGRAALSASENLEWAQCSFIQRVFEPTEATTFHVVDVDKDGFSDIVYTGSALCSEGSATVIWYGTKDGYVVKQPTSWQVLLLRVAPNGHEVISVKQGCCAMLADIYFQDTVDNFRRDSEIALLAKTVLPLKKYSHSLQFKAKRAVALRSSPEQVDAYDRIQSEYIERAVFGNIVRKYLPGTTGTVVGETTKNNRRWFFVVMGEKNNLLVTHDPYVGYRPHTVSGADTVRAGWVPADQLTLVQK
ncbi:hypothetical protein CSQ89_09700 [Chitinimonas sp. BJB300]|nr:hypothetical protein CSQ89_09700 [Chitinimonas sp. BJB300]